ncbi:UNVERIFIED_ORG: hypothetical protein BDK47_11842 [Anoxybacillus amylolyticus]
MIRKLKEKAGYVSVETVVVAGLMLALGAYAISQFYEVGEGVMWASFERAVAIFRVGEPEGPPLGNLVVE